jgi:hypothetical protein
LSFFNLSFRVSQPTSVYHSFVFVLFIGITHPSLIPYLPFLSNSLFLSFISFSDAVNRVQSTLATESASEQAPVGAVPAHNIRMDGTFAARKFYAQRNM